MLNRAAIIARPAAPFMEWVARLDASGFSPVPEDEQTVYLMPDVTDDRDIERKLKQVYSRIFESELFDWHSNQENWPRNRTFAMFRLWFKIEVHTVVEDLCTGPIVDEDSH